MAEEARREAAGRRFSSSSLLPPLKLTQNLSPSLSRQMTKQLYQEFPWNDRKKPALRASNCFMATECNREREIKLKASKERYVENEKRRLMEVEEATRGYF
jgi:hypothetical protein